MSEPFFFDREVLLPLADRHRAAYAVAEPFPHVVLDDFLPPAVIERVAADFPGPSFPYFKQPDNEYQVNKLGRTQDFGLKGLPASIRHLLNELSGMAFLDFLERLTGIDGLIADPHFEGGALHQILPGGRLAIHADFNRDQRRRLDRRINVLLYLNPEWHDAYGGHLELWKADMSACAVRVAPLLNRCVVFSTSETSFHGHPDTLTCPAGMTRRSIALYFYSNGRPAGDSREAHSTLWRLRPGETPPRAGSV